MRISNCASVDFIQRLHTLSKSFLEEIFHVKVHQKTFVFNRYRYPINIVVFEGQSTLGYFSSPFFEIGINKFLLNASDEILIQTLLHEWAHFFTFLKYPNNQESSHGPSFKEICRFYRLPLEVEKASIEKQILDKAINHEKNVFKAQDKFEKLLSLSKSDNIHESLNALEKANQLAGKFNLAGLQQNSEQTWYSCDIFEVKKIQGIHQAISQILRTFHVFPLFHQGHGLSRLEIMGRKDQVLIAEYVGKTLLKKLNDLWEQEKKFIANKKGPNAKNSFMLGVAKGHLEKNKVYQKELTLEEKPALVLLEKELSTVSQKFYPRLSRKASSYSKDHNEARKRGHETGKNLTIKKGLSSLLKKALLSS